MTLGQLYPHLLADPRFAAVAEMPGPPGFEPEAITPTFPSPEPRTIPVAESLAIVRAIRECPHRTAPECGCPDVPGACSREDQPFGPTPFYSDCRACVSEGSTGRVGGLSTSR
jgi:hypothetical protein